MEDNNTEFERLRQAVIIRGKYDVISPEMIDKIYNELYYTMAQNKKDFILSNLKHMPTKTMRKITKHISNRLPVRTIDPMLTVTNKYKFFLSFINSLLVIMQNNEPIEPRKKKYNKINNLLEFRNMDRIDIIKAGNPMINENTEKQICKYFDKKKTGLYKRKVIKLINSPTIPNPQTQPDPNLKGEFDYEYDYEYSDAKSEDEEHKYEYYDVEYDYEYDTSNITEENNKDSVRVSNIDTVERVYGKYIILNVIRGMCKQTGFSFKYIRRNKIKNNVVSAHYYYSIM